MGTGPGTHMHMGPNELQHLHKRKKNMIFVGLISLGANGELKLHTVKALHPEFFFLNRLLLSLLLFV